MIDPIGDRMKNSYENRTRFFLPRRTFTIIRVDGRAFHAYTRGCERPFDASFASDMDAAAIALCDDIQGARLAFVQSDEISVLMTDFDQPNTEAWFDGNLNKIVSLSASIATAAFMAARIAGQMGEPDITADRWASWIASRKIATFDSRAFTIPDPTEVFNYFVWRQKDATRNSILMTGQAHLSHRELQGLGVAAIQDALHAKGVNWAEQPEGFKNGRVVYQETSNEPVTYVDKRDNETKTVEGVERRVWVAAPAPVFLRDREWLLSRIPRYELIGTQPPGASEA